MHVEPGHFIVGENQLALEPAGGKSRIAVGWLRIGTAHPSRGPGHQIDEDPRAAARFDAKRDAIELANNAEVAWYVTIPDGANLIAEIAGACHVEVSARAGDDSATAGLLGGDIKRIDLSPSAGKVVRLSLVARDCPTATLVHPAITLHGPAPTPLPKAEPPRYIILWVMDALRADKIPIFTPGARAQTPNFDELAKSSTVFRQYYVQGNESQTSHSSIWTALYPAVHGVRLAGGPNSINSRLNKKFTLIAGELAAAGMVT